MKLTELAELIKALTNEERAALTELLEGHGTIAQLDDSGDPLPPDPTHPHP